MLRNFLKNRKAQNTAEYALLIALVVAGVIAMQTYCQRALQARIHDVSKYMANVDSGSNDATAVAQIGNSTQYEPYYMQSDYKVASNSVEDKRLGNNLVEADSANNRTRTGYQSSTYDNSGDNDGTNQAQF